MCVLFRIFKLCTTNISQCLNMCSILGHLKCFSLLSFNHCCGETVTSILPCGFVKVKKDDIFISHDIATNTHTKKKEKERTVNKNQYHRNKQIKIPSFGTLIGKNINTIIKYVCVCVCVRTNIHKHIFIHI